MCDNLAVIIKNIDEKYDFLLLLIIKINLNWNIYLIF